MSAATLTAFALLAALVVGRAWGAFAALQYGKHCPSCGRRAIPLTHRNLGRLLARLVERRWCPTCGWEGLRRRRFRVPVPGDLERGSGSRRAAPRPEDRPLLWNERDNGQDDSVA